MSFVLSANRLLDGHVIYLADDGTWTERIERAKRLTTDEEQKSALTFGVAAESSCEIVAADLVPLLDDRQQPTPTRLKEIIRAVGPTVRPDLARQTS